MAAKKLDWGFLNALISQGFLDILFNICILKDEIIIVNVEWFSTNKNGMLQQVSICNIANSAFRDSDSLRAANMVDSK